MPFQITKTLLNIIGLHPDRVQRTRRERIALRVFVFLISINLIPMIVRQVVNFKDDLNKTMTVFMIIFSLTVPIKFIIFYRNYPKICKLMKAIVSKLKPTSMERAKDDEKGIEKIVRIIWISSCVVILPHIYQLIQTTPRNWIDISIQITLFPSSIALNFTNWMLQFIYFNLCIQICSLFKQIEDDLKEIHLIRDKKRLTEMLGDIVEFHQEVHQMIGELLDCFKYILSVSFVVKIWLTGQSLLFSSDKDWVMFLLTSPILLFEAWMFCYASQKIITRAQDTAFLVYSLDWYKFDDNSSKKLLVMIIMKFQKPVKFTLFGMINLNLETFVFMAKTSYSIFNLLVSVKKNAVLPH